MDDNDFNALVRLLRKDSERDKTGKFPQWRRPCRIPGGLDVALVGGCVDVRGHGRACNRKEHSISDRVSRDTRYQRVFYPGLQVT